MGLAETMAAVRRVQVLYGVENGDYPDEATAAAWRGLLEAITPSSDETSMLGRVIQERQNWMETARQYARNSDYWRQRSDRSEMALLDMVQHDACPEPCAHRLGAEAVLKGRGMTLEPLDSEAPVR